MIPTSLLRLTEARAVGFTIYGCGGTWKTLMVHTLPPPILHHDFEGGSGVLMPWIRRRRRYNESEWTIISQEERLEAFAMMPIAQADLATQIAPNGYVDVINYDNLVKDSYMEFVAQVGNFDPRAYNSTSLDSLAEFSFQVQTFTKIQKGISAMDSMDNALLWGPIQEKTAIALRRLRNYRDQGVFIYLIGQENIDKDYVTDPREKRKGEAAPEAYSVKGNVAVPGQMVNVVQHITDEMYHTRFMGGRPVWVTRAEPIVPGSGASWEAKDRFGRVKEQFLRPNIRTVMKDLYGEEGMVAIYAEAKKLLS